MSRCKHLKTSVTTGKNGGEYRTCDNCTAVTKIIRVGPACGEPLPMGGGVCNLPESHVLSDLSIERCGS